MFTRTQRLAVAALFARSNMGKGDPKPEVFKEAFNFEKLSLASAVNWLCGEFLENDEQHYMFFDEASAWYKDPKIWSLTEIRKIWPYKADYIENAIGEQNV